MDLLDLNQIGAEFRSSLPLPANLEPNLYAALRQVLDTPGSLVRPQIVLKVALAYGLPESAARDLAIALEYFHTASLLFDDLPCMDNAAQRRGAPCLHLVYGEAGAILAALGLINRGYALAWKAMYAGSADRPQRCHAYIEEHLGVHGLLNGQSLDLNYSTLFRDQKATEEVAMGKTVSLIKLTLVLPALLGGASEKELLLLSRIAVFWGLSYQTLDDLKDLVQSDRETGKTVARDSALGRPNIALAIGIPATAERLCRLIYLGNIAFTRLLAEKPEMAFLEKLRDDLETESDRITSTMADNRLARGA